MELVEIAEPRIGKQGANTPKNQATPASIHARSANPAEARSLYVLVLIVLGCAIDFTEFII